LKRTPVVITVVLMTVLPGCEPGSGRKGPLGAGREFLTVDFEKGRTLRWDAPETTARPGGRAGDKSSESMEVVMLYRALEVNHYGLTNIEAICESVKVSRSKGSRKDAVQSLAGKTFTLAVGPTGRIEDHSQLDKLLKQIGEKAFRTGTERGRIKEPDMIGDFVAWQWFLWDAISSIEKPSEGVTAGQSWKSKLSVPAPMVMRKARDVTYRLSEIRPSEKGRLAVIASSYQQADSVPQGWPIPYWGSFQMAGPFGFLQKLQNPEFAGPGRRAFQHRRRQNRAIQAAVRAAIERLVAPASARGKPEDNYQSKSDNGVA